MKDSLSSNAPSLVVIAGPDPAIHSETAAIGGDVTEWMPGSSPGKTTAGERPRAAAGG